MLQELSRRVDAPLLVSAVTERGTELFNSSLLWTSEGQEGATYDKRHPVPFGEYVPDRAFWEPFAPDLIGLIGREYTPGTATPLIDLDGVGVGLAICFDVIYDDVVWDGADAGAEVFMFQTNNADFRGTDENLQQLAFAQMRAIETGRSVVNLSTVGTSQVIAPDGSTLDALPIDTAGHMLTDVPLRTGLTPAVVLGPAIKIALGGGSLAGLLAVGVIAALRGVDALSRRGESPRGALTHRRGPVTLCGPRRGPADPRRRPIATARNDEDAGPSGPASRSTTVVDQALSFSFPAPRRARTKARRSSSSSSSSGSVRRSRSMSQCVRAALSPEWSTVAVPSPMRSRASAPHVRHSQASGTSASAANVRTVSRPQVLQV